MILKYDRRTGRRRSSDERAAAGQRAGGIASAALLTRSRPRVLSMENNRITDARPLTALDELRGCARNTRSRTSKTGAAGHRRRRREVRAVRRGWQTNLRRGRGVRGRLQFASASRARPSRADLRQLQAATTRSGHVARRRARADQVTYQVRSRDTTAVVSGLTLFNTAEQHGDLRLGVGTVTINTDTGTSPATTRPVHFTARRRFEILGGKRVSACSATAHSAPPSSRGSRPLYMVV